MKKRKFLAILLSMTLCMGMLTGCLDDAGVDNESDYVEASASQQSMEAAKDSLNNDREVAIGQNSDAFIPDQVPGFTGAPFTIVHDNVPYFTAKDLTTKSYEEYAPLDDLGRCGVVSACVGKDIMPTEKRGSIGQVKPSGWRVVKYDNVDGKYLYNRCHLIGFQLTGENANKENLITGTRYLNIEGMLPFENMVADYVKETGNHVLYRVTPVYVGDDLVANGVLMEAYSVEDKGAGICYCVYAYNVQPGIRIDYATGESWLDDEAAVMENASADADEADVHEYVLNDNSMKFHKPDCASVKNMKNPQHVKTTRQKVTNAGYEACNMCCP